MILTEGLNGKELLLEYKELVANKLNSSRDIKSNEEYFNWYNENKEDLKRLVTLKSSIFYIFDNQIELFTVDEDTYELAVEFLSTYIKDIDYLLNADNLPADFINDGKETKLDDEHKTIALKVTLDTLKDIKSRYLNYLNNLNTRLPKC